MKYTEINAIFTNTVNEYMSKGYTINTATMSGHQGEIAKVDLRKGDDVIRIYLERGLCWYDDCQSGDAVTLVVGRCTDERIKAADSFSHSLTIWNNRLEVIEERVFWEFGRDCDWFIEGNEGIEAIKKHIQRYINRRVSTRKDFDDRFAALVLPAVRRHMGKLRFPMSRIDKIYRETDSHGNNYYMVSIVGSMPIRLR